MVWLFLIALVLSTIPYSRAEVRLPPNIIEPSSAVVLYRASNSNFVVKCKAESKPESPTYKWLKNARPIVSDYVKYDATTGDLSFTGFTKKEEGVYMCLASTVFTSQGGGNITAASLSPTVTVYQIRVGPFTNTVPINKSVDEYSYENLECSNKGEVVGNDIAFNWYKDQGSKRLDTDGGRLYVDLLGNLHFTYVKKSDETAGFTYICGISSPTDGITRFGGTIKLSVRDDFTRLGPVKPQVQYTNSGVQANLYGQAVLECVFSGYDPQPPYLPRIKWTSDDGNDITGNTKYRISNDSRTLTISDLTEQDEKNYYCSAENSAGSVTPQPVFLNVTSAPIFVEGLRDQTVSEGKDVVFNCDARSASNEQPPSAPTWYINGEATGPNTNPSKYVIENKRLTVKSVTKARDILCVQCSVTNSQGTTWGNGCLNVLLTPKESHVSYTSTNIDPQNEHPPI